MELSKLKLYRLSGFYLQNLLNDYPNYYKADRSSYLLAKSYQEIGDIKGAVNIYHHTLTTYPNSSYTSSNWMELGRAYYNLDNFDRSLYSYRMVERTTLSSDDDYESRSAQGVLLFLLGENEKAISKYERLMQDYPDGEYVNEDLYRLANIYLETDQVDRAIEILKAILISGEDTTLISYVKYKLASTYLSRSEFDKIDRIMVGSQLTDDELSIDMNRILYISYYKQERYEDAIKVIRNIIDYFKGLESGLYKEEDIFELSLNLAYLYILTENFNNAEMELNYILSNTQNENIRTYCLYFQGIMRLKILDYDKAFTDFYNVFQDSIKHHLVDNAVYNCAVAKFKDLEYSDAIIYFNEYIEIGDEDELLRYSHYLKSESLYRIYDYNESIKSFSRFIDIYTQSDLTPEAKLRIADCHLKIGNNKKAIAHYQHFVEEYPGHNLIPRALWYQAISYKNEGDVERTRDLYKRLFINHAETDYGGVSFLSYIQLLAEEREFKSVIDEVDKYASWFRGTDIYTEVIWIKGITQYNLHNYNTSKKTFNDIITNYPDADEYQKALYYSYLTDYHLGLYKSPLHASEKFIEEHTDLKLTGDIILKICDYYISGKEYNKAKQNLINLLQNTDDEEMIKEATEMLVKVYELMGNSGDLPSLYLTLMEKSESREERLRYILLIAQSYENNNDYEKAIDYYQIFVDEGASLSNYDEGLYELGKLYKKIGLYNNAIVILERFHTGFYKSEYRYPALLILAYSHQLNGNLVDAIEIHKIVILGDDPTLTVQSIYWIGECNYHLGKRKEAKKWLERVIKTFPEKTKWVEKAQELIEVIEKYE